MRHDRQPSARHHDRKEWGSHGDQQHQMEAEAREHARLPGKSRRAYGARRDEAERQIRELRGRY